MDKLAFNASVFFGSPAFPAPAIDTSVSVTHSDGSGLAEIYSDKAGNTKVNPFNIANPGQIVFYVDPGEYNVTAQQGSNVASWSNVLVIPRFPISKIDSGTSRNITNSDVGCFTQFTNDVPVTLTFDIDSVTILDAEIHIINDQSKTQNLILNDLAGVTVKKPANLTQTLAPGDMVTMKLVEYTAGVSATWVMFGKTVAA